MYLWRKKYDETGTSTRDSIWSSRDLTLNVTLILVIRFPVVRWLREIWLRHVTHESGVVEVDRVVLGLVFDVRVAVGHYGEYEHVESHQPGKHEELHGLQKKLQTEIEISNLLRNLRSVPSYFCSTIGPHFCPRLISNRHSQNP